MLGFDLPNNSWLAALTFGYRGLLQPEDWHLVQKNRCSAPYRYIRLAFGLGGEFKLCVDSVDCWWAG